METVDQTKFDVAESVTRWRQALGFVAAAGLEAIGTDAQQVTPCESTADVNRLLAIGFTPYRYTHNPDVTTLGVLETHIAGVHIFSACDGWLLDYAELVAE